MKKILFGNMNGKDHFEDSQCGLEDYMETLLREVNGSSGYWIYYMETLLREVNRSSGYWIYFPAGLKTTINLCE